MRAAPSIACGLPLRVAIAWKRSRAAASLPRASRISAKI